MLGNFYQNKAFFPNSEDTVLISIDLKNEDRYNPNGISELLQGTVQFYSSWTVSDNAIVRNELKFNMEFAGDAKGYLRFKAEIPVLYFRSGRYFTEIRIKDKISGEEFIYNNSEDSRISLTIGMAGFIRMHSIFIINDNSFKYAISDFQKIQKFLPEYLEGRYSTGFCSDEYLTLDEITMQIWNTAEPDELDIAMHYSIDGAEFNHKADFTITDDSRNGNILYDGAEYEFIDEENSSFTEYSIIVNAAIDDILGQLSYEAESVHDIRFYIIVSSGGEESRYPESGYIELNFKVANSPTGADCQASLLPIDLLTWDVVLKEKIVYLKWITAHEVNNDYFEIEKSSDAINWISIEKIPGKGNSNSVNHYFSSDNYPLPGFNYYRLKQTDFDGGNKFSKTKMIRNSENEIMLYPNPVSSYLYYSVVDPGKNYYIEIFNSQGQLVESHTVPEFSAYKNKIDLRHLDKGIYILKYINLQNFQSRVMRLVKL